MPLEVIIIGAVGAVLGLITAIIGLVREINQRRKLSPLVRSITEDQWRRWDFEFRAALDSLGKSDTFQTAQMIIRQLPTQEREVLSLALLDIAVRGEEPPGLGVGVQAVVESYRRILTNSKLDRLKPTGAATTHPGILSTYHEPWYFRLVRRSLPKQLRQFDSEIAADRRDALEQAATHPEQAHRWSDRREVFSLVITILKYRIFSIQVKTERARRVD